MQLTLIRTAKAIVYFGGVLIVLIVCASFGILLLYTNYKDEWRIEMGDFGRLQCSKQDGGFADITTIAKILFWHLYGYGETDDADLVVRNKLTANFTEDEIRRELIVTVS